jgi:hypothetical protein
LKMKLLTQLIIDRLNQRKNKHYAKRRNYANSILSGEV